MPISVKELTKIYGEQRAIDRLSFEVNRGEILGFLGPNGAGKTTTMKIISCYLAPTSGTVTLDEYNIFDHPMEVRRQIGYLPEHNPLYLDMYVHEFLDFAARIYGFRGPEARKRIQWVIDQTGLGREQHKKIGMLSKGYRQRVGLAQALIHDPQVLILDEPTTGLDPNQIVEIRSLIRDLGKDKTVIFSSHILSEVEAIADRVIIINQGKLVADQANDKQHLEPQEEYRIHLEVMNSGLNSATLLQMEGVLKVLEVSLTAFEIRTAGDADLRPAIFRLCATTDNPILLLQREALTLEDTFRKLTANPSPSESAS